MKDTRATAIVIHQIAALRQMADQVDQILRDERARLLQESTRSIQPAVDAREMNDVLAEMGAIRWKLRRLHLMARGLEG